MNVIKPAVIGTCKRKGSAKICEYVVVGEKYDKVYEDFLGSCYDGFHTANDHFLSIALVTDQGKYRTAETGEIILKHSLGFKVIHYLEVFEENYDY